MGWRITTIGHEVLRNAARFDKLEVALPAAGAARKHNIAAYLASQQAKPGAAKDKDTIDLGKKIYRGGIAETKVPACASCHGATGNGIPVQYPRIAGQHQDYTVAQLGLFKSGARNNSPQMTTIAKRMSDDEMKAVADYIAGLK